MTEEKKESKIDDLLFVVRTNMKRIRREKAITLKDISEKFEISEAYLSRVENGKQKLNFDLIDRYAIILNVDPFDFFMPQAIIENENSPIYVFGENLKNNEIDVGKLEEWIQENFKKGIK